MRESTTLHKTRGGAPRAAGRRGTVRTSLAVRFARAISLRYEFRRQWSCRVLDLVLHRGSPGVTFQLSHREGDLRIAPILRLVMLIWGSRPEMTGGNRSGGPVPRLIVARDAYMPRPGRRSTTAGTVERDRLIRRVTAWRERIEVWPGGSPSSFVPLPKYGQKAGTFLNATEGQPPTKILRRSIPPEIEPKDALRRVARQAEGPELTKVANSTNQRPRETAIDMNYLTDGVIRAIDRRIIAQRERLGRG
jgi:hypothetical protein